MTGKKKEAGEKACVRGMTRNTLINSLIFQSHNPESPCFYFFLKGEFEETCETRVCMGDIVC
jgi:hypothetical protein